jgi:alpha-D-ribose 1-methylphosphonate 5-triphosphate synthase subunit PhnG
MTASDTNEAARRRWLAVLARAGRDELAQAAEALGLPPGEPVRPAETGMVMLRGRVGGTGDAFNLGEATVTRCARRVDSVLGIGYTLGRDRRKAELIAAFDAALQQPTLAARVLREAIAPMEAAQQARREAESQAVAGSRVDFYTMVRGEA